MKSAMESPAAFSQPDTHVAAGGRSTWNSALRFGLIAGFLVVFTWWVYSPVRGYGFVTFDDPEYVTENPMVRGGLTAESVKWAFTTSYFSYWHPLTWLSHQLDAQLFGASPAGPHVVNVLIHAINAVLVLVLLRKLTGSIGRSTAVAALFALHPLHVESVAWISERKDVLSAFFFLLTLWAYVRYAQERAGVMTKIQGPMTSAGTLPTASHWSLVVGHWSFFYCAAVLLFACALMSKPMVVTLPCVLLLLDYWPLRRWGAESENARRRVFARLVVEKLPFFALAAAASAATVWAQRKNEVVQSLSEFSLAGRLENAAVAYLRYLGKTVWPTDLAFFYPHPGDWPALVVGVAALVLSAVSFAALRMARRVPAALLGWCWFIGMLVPTIGVIQVGGQSLADRYTYLPHIGLFMAVVWCVAEMGKRTRWARVVVILGSVAVVLGCTFRTRDQVGHWRDSESLFRHALAVTENNFVAHNNLANVLVAAGKAEEAITHYRQALAIRAHDDHAANNLGAILLRTGRVEEAIPALRRAVELQPGLVSARHALCHALFRAGRAPEAISHLETILTIEPRNSQVHADLGVARLQAGEPAQALRSLQSARELGGDDAEIRRTLGRALVQLGRSGEAIPHFQAALAIAPALEGLNYELAIALFQNERRAESIPHFEAAARAQPGNAELQSNFGWALLVLDRVDDAIARFQAALRADPAAMVAQTNLAGAWLRKGDARAAIACFERALAQQPEHVQAMRDLAWVLATWPSDEVRDGTRALGFARRAQEISAGRDPEVLRVLAAAYAETGAFAQAREAAQQGLRLIGPDGDEALREALRVQLARYEAGVPFRDPIALSGSKEGNQL